tara:strand:+ start:2458 stop:3789 length:1332 start_codon:yes stop_codon:yes gene_type:complete
MLPGQFNFIDLLISPIYIGLIFLVAFLLRDENLNLKYYYRGLSIKIFGGLIFWLVYTFVYGGGDAWAYFYSAKSISNLLIQDFDKGWAVISAQVQGIDIFPYFNQNTGTPAYYMARDFHTFTVARYTSIFSLITFNSFLTSTILISALSFIGIWKLYSLIVNLYPTMKKPAFYLVIAMPSLIFWGGGIMKDTYVLSSCCWFSYNFYFIFIKRKKILINLFFIMVNTVIIINIKSYLLISLIPGSLLWLNSAYLKNINNYALKIITFPIIIGIISFAGFFVFQNISSFMGEYGNVESAIQQAQVIQEDLLREESYGKNNYNIGTIDGSLTGMISLAPMAIFTALYRPLPWEIGSPMMIISALENILLIVVSIFLLIRLNPISFLKIILKEPFLLFAFTFSFVFAFGVGIASTNFGALVRYKIPLMPFFFTGLYIINYLSKNVKE